MKSLPRHIVGVTVMVIAMAIIAGLFFVDIPQGNREIALIILGLAAGWASAVVQFHYGSSEGSKSKSERIGQMQEIE